MTDYIEHRGVSRKTFLMYLLQLPFVAGFAKYLYGFEPKKHYEGKIKLGGCMIEMDDPNWHCKKCSHDY